MKFQALGAGGLPHRMFAGVTLALCAILFAGSAAAEQEKEGIKAPANKPRASREEGEEKEKPEAPPESVKVQTLVILASKGKVPHEDENLKELAKILKKRFKGQFNRFRLHKETKTGLKLQPPSESGSKPQRGPVTVRLIDDYRLKLSYLGVKRPKGDEKPAMVTLGISVVKAVETIEDEKKVVKEKTVIPPIRPSVVPGLFVLIGGPRVGEETLVLAVRARK